MKLIVLLFTISFFSMKAYCEFPLNEVQNCDDCHNGWTNNWNGPFTLYCCYNDEMLTLHQSWPTDDCLGECSIEITFWSRYYDECNYLEGSYFDIIVTNVEIEEGDCDGLTNGEIVGWANRFLMVNAFSDPNLIFGSGMAEEDYPKYADYRGLNESDTLWVYTPACWWRDDVLDRIYKCEINECCKTGYTIQETKSCNHKKKCLYYWSTTNSITQTTQPFSAIDCETMPPYENGCAEVCSEATFDGSHPNFLGLRNWTPTPPPPPVEPLEVNEKNLLKNQIEIFPNPAGNELYFRLNLKYKFIEKIEIFGQLGNILVKQNVDKNISEYHIDISKLKTGTYNIKISLSDDEIFVKRIVVIK